MPATAPAIDLADHIGRYYNNPLGYVLFAFDWGHGDLKGSDGPDEWQSAFLAEVGEELKRGADLQTALQFARASGHGVGKSALVAWLIIWAMSTRPYLAGVCTANTKNQLDTKTWRELSVWHKRAINADWFSHTATKFSAVESPDTWFVAAIPWSENNSEAFAGLHAEHVLVVFDEASAIPDLIWETTEGAMTTAGAMWFAFGNPTRNTGRFRECFGRLKHRWNAKQVDSRNAKMTNKAQIQAWIDDYGDDSDFVRIRVKGEFPRAGSNQFISSDLLDEAKKRPASTDNDQPKVLGVDVARFGDDQSVILLRHGRSIPVIKAYRNMSTVELAGRVAEFIDEHAPDAVFIDGVGVGGGVVDRLKQLNYDVIEVNAGAKAHDDDKYANKRAEMWGLTRDWLAGGSLPDDRELSDDLQSPEYGFDARNRIQLEKKEDMKKRGLGSPDKGDALSLTFAQPVVKGGREALKLKMRPSRGGWMAS